MNDVSEKLRDSYAQYWQDLQRTLGNFDTVKNKISYPLLLDNITEYWDTEIKLIVVGQQTNGWGDGFLGDRSDEDVIDKLMANYRIFNVGERYNDPFFSISKKLCKCLNPDGPEVGYMWTNLVKVDQSGGRPTPEIEEAVCNSFPVIVEEIERLDPDAIVFFTGPYYDERLLRTFKNAELVEVDGFSINEFAFIKYNYFPKKTFRTYHPRYLRMSQKENDIIKSLVKLIKD